MDRKAWRAVVHKVTKSQTRLKQLSAQVCKLNEPILSSICPLSLINTSISLWGKIFNCPCLWQSRLQWYIHSSWWTWAVGAFLYRLQVHNSLSEILRTRYVWNSELRDLEQRGMHASHYVMIHQVGGQSPLLKDRNIFAKRWMNIHTRRSFSSILVRFWMI